jgi:1-deoxy-D-xylulose-5-phosphate reductoisomerase
MRWSLATMQHYTKVKDALFDEGIKVFAGEDALAQIVEMEDIDMVLTALVGYAGLRPTMAAIRAGKHIALANKETLVVAGELVTELAKEKAVNIYPVDSEHSAIFQCLVGEFHNPIEKIYLTASGGPFRGKKREELMHVTKAQALKHPNWDMGAKITIDSASMMNKGLEVIEAKWLFGLKTEQIDVIVHPQSIVHSIVQFEDGSMKAQMGLPDMKLPIQFALGYPNRLKSDFHGSISSTILRSRSSSRTRNRSAIWPWPSRHWKRAETCHASSMLPTRWLWKHSLHDKVSFLGMSDLIADCMAKATFIAKPSYEDYVASDAETRSIAKEGLRLLKVQ